MASYRPLQSAEDGDGEAGPMTTTPRTTPATTAALSLRRLCASVLFLAVLGATNLLSLGVGALAGRQAAYAKRALDYRCAAHTAQYSPLLGRVGIEYSPVRFNGSFLHENVYRRPGAPDVDAAWEALGVDYRAGVVPPDEGLRSGLSPRHVQRAARYGGGFFVNVEGLHHLHCLNLVRKALYYNYPYYRALGTHAFQNDEPILQRHVSHCVDTLRQVLMCNVDTGLLGQVWAAAGDPDDAHAHAPPAAFPDFYTTHTCKNFDAVRRWAQRLQAPPVDDLPPDYLQPPDPDSIWPSTP